jgi:hypothetical protein
VLVRGLSPDILLSHGPPSPPGDGVVCARRNFERHFRVVAARLRASDNLAPSLIDAEIAAGAVCLLS